MADLTPITLLKQLEASVISTVKGLPEQGGAVDIWSGIGFKLGSYDLVSPMSEVTELLRVPAFTRLPNVKPWVLGVSNIRGRLIPLVDLNMFFETNYNQPMRSRRVLVIEQNDQAAGLIVDGVEGMQYFPVDSFSDESTVMGNNIEPFVDGQFTKDKRVWARFSMSKLSGDPEFQDVAI